jgi:tellurite resistance protein TehA-like permease
MRSLMLQAWPEGTTKMLSLGLSPKQPPAVAAAALTFVAVAMASSSGSLKLSADQPVPVWLLTFLPLAVASLSAQIWQ